MLSLPIYKLGSSYYLHTRIAGKQVKKSLRTSYKRVAIIRAVSLLNSLTMSQKLNIEDFPHLLDSKNIQRKYELDLSKGILKADDEEDHQRLLEAIEALKSTRQHFPAAQPQQEHVEPSKLIPDDPTALKLDELLEKFLLLRPIKQGTASHYRNCVAELRQFLKNPPITRIAQSDITRYQEHIASNGNSIRTVDNKIAVIRSLFNFAKKQGYTRYENPAENRALLSKKEKLKGGYSIFEKEEIEKIFKSEFFKIQKEKDKDYTICLILALATGCRIGEITNLKKEQFKLSESGNNYITIRDSKTLAGIREVPIHPLFYKRIEPFLTSKKDKLFKYGEIEGRGTGNAVGKKFARHLEKSGITREKLVFHSLRKFVNNELMRNKVSLEHRSQFIGHELENVNIATYTEQLNIDELADVVFPTLEKIFNLIKPYLLKTAF